VKGLEVSPAGRSSVKIIKDRSMQQTPRDYVIDTADLHQRIHSLHATSCRTTREVPSRRS
jgi:hypothetical protein